MNRIFLYMSDPKSSTFPAAGKNSHYLEPDHGGGGNDVRIFTVTRNLNLTDNPVASPEKRKDPLDYQLAEP